MIPSRADAEVSDARMHSVLAGLSSFDSRTRLLKPITALSGVRSSWDMTACGGGSG